MKKGVIRSFKGEYSWLSNFENLQKKIVYQGIKYPTVEHYYVAMKFQDKTDRVKVSELKFAGQAKIFGKKAKLPKDWERIKLQIMWKALNFKYSKYNPKLLKLLLDTGSAELIEGNYHNDDFWGVDLHSGKGKNILGKMIMEIRFKRFGEKLCE